MGIFDASILDKIANAIDDLGTNQANAIIEGFEHAANIIADRLDGNCRCCQCKECGCQKKEEEK